MIGQINLKRLIKKTAGYAAALSATCFPKNTPEGVCIFVYHRVADIGFVDPHIDDWNVHPSIFEAQVACLTSFADIISIQDLSKRLLEPRQRSRPVVCLTFDDAYANFFTNVLPILKRYQAPASVFAVTSLVGSREPMPFDSWSQQHFRHTSPEAWRPMNWKELEQCMNSGLVTVGGHSHRHRNGLSSSAHELDEEANSSYCTLQRELGSEACRFYAFPYGSRRLGQVNEAYIKAVRKAGYQMAMTTDLGLATPHCDPFSVPRVEAHEVDTESILFAKAHGVLKPYSFTDRLRRKKRFSGTGAANSGMSKVSNF